MNNVILMGRLTADPELKQRQDGSLVLAFHVACDRQTRNGSEKAADFIRCIAFEKNAENISKYFRKGMKIAIIGSIRTGSYEKNNVTIHTTDVYVSRFEFVESKNTQAAPPTNYPPQGYQAPPPQNYQQAAPPPPPQNYQQAPPQASFGYGGSVNIGDFEEIAGDGDLPF